MKNVYSILLLLLLSNVAIAQNTLFGNIEDTNGEPLPGANIMLVGTDYATMSDADGFFLFRNLEVGQYQLEVSYVGFTTVEKTVNVKGKTNIDINLGQTDYEIKGVVISSWATSKTPMSYTNIDKEELEKNNLGQDVPYLLRWTPSAVITSDAGTGIGYTGIRIRGSDPSRINVTINGIPLNDSESQGVFWVDLPDFASSTESIQIQRGVGTSTNGAGAFGATIGLNTAKINKEAYGQLSNSIGSFGTIKNSINLGTGLLKNKFTFDGRLSRIISDGYIDRASADLNSFYVSGAYLGNKSSVRLNVFSGHEVTYQAWNGVPAQFLEDDELRTFNTAGTEKSGEPHDNEVDDYRQTHYQAFYDRQLGTNSSVKMGAHYTRGRGFFEQYKAGQAFEDYGLENVAIGGDTLVETDLIRRRWLDNDFFGFIYSYSFSSKDDKLQFSYGSGWNRYKGKHFGEILWAQFASNGIQDHRYYDNDAEKTDLNVYAKVNYQLNEKLNGYLDLQYRKVDYEFLGFDNDGSSITQSAVLRFFNPKVGLFYDLSTQSKLYASFAVANREPNRSDYTESTPTSRPEHETLYNTEIGYRQSGEKYNFGANFYHMLYDNQLVLTGQINDVGEYTRRNVDDSYRAGIELVGGIEIVDGLSFSGSATFSQNKINSFTEFIDNWDTGGQEEVQHEDTDLALSPNVVIGAELSYDVMNNVRNQDLTLSLLTKYVGKQFIDNTSNENTMLDAYSFSDFRILYKLKNTFFKEVGLTLLVRNIFDAKFASNAWTYRYISEGFDGREFDPYTRLESGSTYNLTGFYPQAGRNFLLGLTIGF